MQLVEFELQGVGLSEYEALCEELAPTFAEFPGLISKVWIADSTAAAQARSPEAEGR